MFHEHCNTFEIFSPQVLKCVQGANAIKVLIKYRLNILNGDYVSIFITN